MATSISFQTASIELQAACLNAAATIIASKYGARLAGAGDKVGTEFLKGFPPDKALASEIASLASAIATEGVGK